jgi:hypothetical protein
MICVKHFRDLEVYQRAMEIVMSVSELTKEFPADEKFVFDRSDSTILAFDLCESGGSMEEEEVSCSVQSLVLNLLPLQGKSRKNT